MKTWKPTAAGIANIVFGLAACIGEIQSIVAHLHRHNLEAFSWGIPACVIALALVAISSGWLCLSRRTWWLALITSVLGIPAGGAALWFASELFPTGTFNLTVPLYPVLASLVLVAPTALVAVSKGEFHSRAEASAKT